MQQFLSVQARPVAACYLGESPHRRVAEVRGSEVTYWGQRTVSLTPGTKSTLRRAIQSGLNAKGVGKRTIQKLGHKTSPQQPSIAVSDEMLMNAVELVGAVDVGGAGPTAKSADPGQATKPPAIGSAVQLAANPDRVLSVSVSEPAKEARGMSSDGRRQHRRHATRL